LFSGQTYSATDLGFGQGEDPNERVLYVEGLNQGGGSPTSPQPTAISVEVQSGGSEYSDHVRLTVVEANLGVNNSSHEPFNDEFTTYGTLRPGIPDTEFEIDQYDEIVEDQGEGFLFWKPPGREGTRPIDMFPIAIDIPLALRNSGYEFFLRTDIEDAGLLIGRDFSSAANPLGYINERSKFFATISHFSTRANRLTEWVLPKTEIGTRSKYLLYPRSFDDLTSTDVMRVQLVGRDRSRNEVVVDSFKLTLKPLIWEGQAHNDLFWVGSARGEPGGSFDYPADSVAGSRVSQDIQIYPQFLWVSGPDPDKQKENYLAYIHGFNINPDQAFRDSAEIYKRMWWSGYRGNFFALTWHGDEWDPLNHICDDLPEIYSIACLAQFFPNMENAMQTSPRLRQFLVETVLGDWGADPQNVNLMVHSLGNLVTLDAFRLHAIESGERLINNMISVEAAVWQETLWDQGPVIISGDLTYTEEDLMRGSWAFWFNQNENPISDSFENMYNSFTRKDEALVAMKFNDSVPIFKIPCTYPKIPGPPLGICPRVDRTHGRGSGQNYRVPVADGIRVWDSTGAGIPENWPDLAYEIPALLDSDPEGGFHLPLDDLLIPPWNALTNPLGMEAAPGNSMNTLHSIDTMELAWPETEHSWFLEGELWEIWPWYENLTTESGIPPRAIIPPGEE
jgi:hypothetical protein